jgi:hypothetical protein
MFDQHIARANATMPGRSKQDNICGVVVLRGPTS